MNSTRAPMATRPRAESATEQLDRLLQDRQAGLVVACVAVIHHAGERSGGELGGLLALEGRRAAPSPAGTAAIDNGRPSGRRACTGRRPPRRAAGPARCELSSSIEPRRAGPCPAGRSRRGRPCDRPGSPEPRGAGAARRRPARPSSCRCPCRPGTRHAASARPGSIVTCSPRRSLVVPMMSGDRARRGLAWWAVPARRSAAGRFAASVRTGVRLSAGVGSRVDPGPGSSGATRGWSRGWSRLSQAAKPGSLLVPAAEPSHGHHRPPVRVLAPRRGGRRRDQLAELLDDRRFGLLGNVGRAHDDGRVLAGAAGRPRRSADPGRPPVRSCSQMPDQACGPPRYRRPWRSTSTKRPSACASNRSPASSSSEHALIAFASIAASSGSSRARARDSALRMIVPGLLERCRVELELWRRWTLGRQIVTWSVSRDEPPRRPTHVRGSSWTCIRTSRAGRPTSVRDRPRERDRRVVCPGRGRRRFVEHAQPLRDDLHDLVRARDGPSESTARGRSRPGRVIGCVSDRASSFVEISRHEMTTTAEGMRLTRSQSVAMRPAEPDRGVVEVVNVLELVDAEDQRDRLERRTSVRPAAG